MPNAPARGILYFQTLGSPSGLPISGTKYTSVCYEHQMCRGRDLVGKPCVCRVASGQADPNVSVRLAASLQMQDALCITRVV